MSLLGPYRPMPKAAGSTVVVNPELVGNEPQLTGLEVDGEKYAVPHLYWHTVTIDTTYGSDPNYYNVYIVVLATFDTPINKDILKSFLTSKPAAKFPIVSGYMNNGGIPHRIMNNGEYSFQFVYYVDGVSNVIYQEYTDSKLRISDDVDQIF